MSNAYGSLLDSFAALDVYNLPMPVVPPADLTIGIGEIPDAFLSVRNGAVNKVVGFSPDDNPYLRSIGISSNLADGLVDGSSAHRGSSSPTWQIKIRPIRMGLAFPGTATIALNAVVGVGCLFTQFCAVGMLISWHDANSVLRTAEVLTVTDDNNLVLTANILTTGMFTGASNAVTVLPYAIGTASDGLTIAIPIMNTQFLFNTFLLNQGVVTQPLGKITAVAGSATINGVGTNFLTAYPSPGARRYVIGWIDDLGVRRTGIVNGVASDTVLTLRAVVVATGTGTNVPILDIDESLRILVGYPSAFFAYTISIDPSYGAANRRLSLHILAEIEHTFALNKTILQ